jgi:anti-sigma B factor antagonist
MSLHHGGPLLRVEPFDDVLLVKVLTTDLGEPFIQAVGAELTRLVVGRAGVCLHLDLGEVRFLTSNALGLMVALHKRLRDTGGRLVVLGVSQGIHDLFRLTRLDSIFEVRRDTQGKPPLTGAARLAC